MHVYEENFCIMHKHLDEGNFCSIFNFQNFQKNYKILKLIIFFNFNFILKLKVEHY